jgi:hypothetical protein
MLPDNFFDFTCGMLLGSALTFLYVAWETFRDRVAMEKRLTARAPELPGDRRESS